MSYQIFQLPKQTLFGGGVIKPSWKVNFFVTGTSTPAPVYNSSALSVAHTQPVQADSSGILATVFLDPSVIYKASVYDQSDVLQYTVDPVNDSVLSQAAIGALLHPRTAAEIAAGVTPTDYAYPPYVRGRYASWTNWESACDQAGAEGSLDADYAIVSDTSLPNKCDFKGFKITGSFYTDHVSRRSGYVKGWVARQPRVRGAFFCQYTGINTDWDLADTGFITVDGGGAGTAWSDFQIAYTRKLELSNDNGYVNFNKFHGGIARYVHLTGASSGTDLHANLLEMLDATDNGAGTDWGFLHDCASNQVNFISNCYYENGSDIVGNFHVIGHHGDADHVPKLSRYSHLLMVTGINERMSRDFLSLTVNNLAVGGNWDILDASNKPPCLAHSGGASVAALGDSTEPCGIIRRYEASFADAFDNFQITLQPSGSDKFGLVLFYKSTDDFVSIESNDGSGAISHTPSPVTVDSTNNWKMLRIAGPASKTATTSVTLYAYSGSGGSTKVISIGGIFAGAERALIVPQRVQTQIRYASTTYDPISLADGAGVTTTVSVTGVALGGIAQASFSLDLQGITLTAWVSSANTVSVRFQNESGGTIDLASGTLRVQVQDPYA